MRIALFVVALLFVVLAALVAPGPILFDLPLLRAMEASRTDGLTRFVRALTDLGGHLWMVPLGVATFALLFRRARRAGAFYAFAAGGSAVLNEGLKLVFARPRPSLIDPVYTARGLSFPSGHSQASMTFALALLLALWRLESRGRRAAVALLVFPLVIGATRVYLGVHYPSDVLGGWALGATWVLLCDLWLQRVDLRVVGAAGPPAP